MWSSDFRASNCVTLKAIVIMSGDCERIPEDYKEFLSEDIDNYALQIFYFFSQVTFCIFSAKSLFFGKSHFWEKLDDFFSSKNPYYEINILILYRVKGYKGTFSKYRN